MKCTSINCYQKHLLGIKLRNITVELCYNPITKINVLLTKVQKNENHYINKTVQWLNLFDSESGGLCLFLNNFIIYFRA